MTAIGAQTGTRAPQRESTASRRCSALGAPLTTVRGTVGQRWAMHTYPFALRVTHVERWAGVNGAPGATRRSASHLPHFTRLPSSCPP